MIKYCISCNKQIPEKRLEVLPLTKTCISCSNTDKLVGVPTNIGSSIDDSYTDITIMSKENYTKLYPTKSSNIWQE